MVNFFDMRLVNNEINLKKVLVDVSESFEFSLGEYVSSFEENFSNYLESRYCVGVGNGTDGLELAMLSVGVTKKDTIVTVANAGFYTSTAANAIGASIEYIDINDKDLLIDLDALQDLIMKKNNIKAIVITHLFGQVVDMKRVLEITKNTNIKIIEDCSHAHGNTFKGKKVGTFGDAGVFSFYPTKNLGAIGDGGAVVTDNKEVYEKLLSLRQYGWSSKYYVKNMRGRNSRLDALQAAILSEKLLHLDNWNMKRLSISSNYNKMFKNLPLKLLDNLSVQTPHLYPIRTIHKKKLIKYLFENKIQTQIHYPVPDHKQEIVTKKYKSLPVTEQSCDEILSLPMYPNMPEEHQEKVIDAVLKFFEEL